jgi:hypothetical protein
LSFLFNNLNSISNKFFLKVSKFYRLFYCRWHFFPFIVRLTNMKKTKNRYRYRTYFICIIVPNPGK